MNYIDINVLMAHASAIYDHPARYGAKYGCDCGCGGDIWEWEYADEHEAQALSFFKDLGIAIT